MLSNIMNFTSNVDWSGLLTPGISILEKVIRTVVVYLFLIIGLRIAGKRELAQMNPFDIVVLFLLSNAVQNALIGNDNSLLGGIVGSAVLLIINYIIVRYMYFNNKAEKVLEGVSDMLIENGVLKTD
ncbi:MAG: hypothetical protein Q8930_18435, partial [Bacillota bacterium]|nr:hypothetical protein [Bacillota bacterium]